ncbi:hypothetical protein A7U60_g7664 [Sanghuangporus baumii]|uniref:Uncharacterized protein n=1 Tax=Sanghuangporus baumii TaxID=108892 RepID=A0A9Q5HT01_SANBA|nr:hypothetical protein A7U60_g7664 [Sanghuangporus baumii]
MAGHASSNDFCTKCKASHEVLKTSEGLKDVFVHRTGEENRRLAFQYRALETDEEKKQFFDTYGVGYTELARLPYFDLVRMTVVDPMHNILLGIMRCQWHDSWIKTNALRKRTEPNLVPRELDLLNAYLKEFEMPSWVGRLPSNVGYPAAGSLSADEYKSLALVYLPVILPFVWSEWQPVAEKDHEMTHRRWRRGPMTEPEPKIRMHEDEPANFLKLAAALKILLGRSIRQLHPEDVKPNFHWVVHMFDQIQDYGPVYSFWTFTFERLNKVLKSYKTNNHAGGEIEVSFFREFHRDIRLRDFVSTIHKANEPLDTGSLETTKLILETEKDCRGTVASLCREIDEATADTRKRFSAGPSSVDQLPNALQKHLVQFYETYHADARVYARNATFHHHTALSPNFLSDRVEYLKYIILDGRRIIPSIDTFRAPNSIIQAQFNGGKIVGQVIRIIKHCQRFVEGSTILLHVRWFKPLERNILNTHPWDIHPELEVGFFEFDSYIVEPPPLLRPEDVISQACRVRIFYRQPRTSADVDEEDDEPPRKIWATVGLTKDILAI